MLEQVAVLQKLRERDDSIQSLLTRIRAREADLERKATEEALVREALELERRRLTACEAGHREAGRSVDSCQANKARFEKQLHDVKTNTEYHALLREIANMEKKVRELEDVALECMEGEEAAKRTLAKLEAETSQKVAITKSLRDVVAREAAAAETEIEALRMQREELLSQLPRPVRSKYDRLLKSKGQTAIATLVNGSCGGCHYALPPRVGADVRRADRMVLCEGCGRILVAPEPVSVRRKGE